MALASAKTVRTTKPEKRTDWEKVLLSVSFLGLPIVFLAVFNYYPALKLIQLSFTEWDGMSADFSYVGWRNFRELLGDSSVLQAFLNTLAYVGAMLIQTAIALYLAIVLDGKLRAKNWFKSIISLPFILNGVAVIYMFNLLYDGQFGPLNELLKMVGLGPVEWLPHSYGINVSLAFMGIWKNTGFAMIIFLGALQSIPRDIYEAAEIDGAHYFQRIRYISIPSIVLILELNLFLGLNGAMQAYQESFIMYPAGSPGSIAETLMTKTLNTAFRFSQFGKASALAVMLMLFILTMVLLQRLILKEKEETA